MCKGAGTRSKPSFFIHGNERRECVARMYHGECVTGLCKGAGTRSKPSFFIHGNVSRECVTGMCKGAGTRSKPSFFIHGNVSRECVTGMYHGECVTGLCKGAGTRSKPSFFIHGNMSRECVAGMCKGAGTRSKPSFILSGDYADTGVRRIFDGKRKVRSLVTRFLVGVAEHCDWRVCLLHMSLRTHISRIMCPNFAISCMRVTVAMISLSFDSAF